MVRWQTSTLLSLQGLVFAVGLGAAVQPSSQTWSAERKLRAREDVRGLWNHGFDNYMAYAFPMDELQPISCQGKGPDWDNPSNYGANDVNGNFSITLVDVLDTFITLNDPAGFDSAVRKVISHVSFDVDTKPQVFETTIRALGGLLSAHLFASDQSLSEQFASSSMNQSSHRAAATFKLEWYHGELLDLALDLGNRLLPAFETPTGMPYARINLRSGVPPGETTQTCTAGAGSLLLEFTTLSRLTGDPRFEEAAKRAFIAVWERRTSIGLLGNGIDVITGSWYYPIGGGIGAGIDSFYEYALKMYVLTGEQPYYDVWNEAYAAIMKYSKGSDGHWYRSINAYNGEVAVTHIDSLGAFWPGLQVLAGDIENAIKSHIIYWNIWSRFSGIPETFNIVSKEGITVGYPLRPEFIESTYFLYRATKDPFYLTIGERVLKDLMSRAKVPCGLSTIANLLTGELEDRMESFVLSETLKYLFLLFDEENPINRLDSNFVFTTEGHVLTLSRHQLKTNLPTPTGQTPGTKGANATRHNDTCSVYHPPVLWLAANNRTASASPSHGGLVGSIEDRRDVEYARHLVGLESGALIRQRPDGVCDIPGADIYISNFVLAPYGQQASEDESPSIDKIATVSGGWMVYDITGLRLEAATRLDGKGSDIIQLGGQEIKRSQKVYFADPRLLKESEVPVTSANHYHDVPLHFFLESTEPKGQQKPLGSGTFVPHRLSTVGAAADYGDHPGRALNATEWHARTANRNRPGLRFGRGSLALPLVQPPPDNLYGCRPYHSPQSESESESPFAFNPPYPDVVLLIKRGECTFFDKLNYAEQAGAKGIIVTSNEIVAPSLTPSDTDHSFAHQYLQHVGMVVVAGEVTVQTLEKMMALSQVAEAGVRLMVEVDSTVASGADAVAADKPAPRKSKTEWDTLRKAGYGRPLYINGKRIHNAVLLF